MRSRLIAFACALLCLSSCGRPTSGEMFLPAPRNSYDFPVDVQDSLAQYDFSFYTRVDDDERVCDPLRFDISWVAPTDTVYRETVYMYAGDEHGKLQRYRTYLSFPATGQWVLKVSVSPEMKGFRGLGLVWTERNGTR